MKPYTFYLHQGPDSVPAFEIEMFADRNAALGFARKLLAERGRYDQVVVTEDDDEIARLDRPERRWDAEAVGGDTGERRAS